jgi:hypothetical protein
LIASYAHRNLEPTKTPPRATLVLPHSQNARWAERDETRRDETRRDETRPEPDQMRWTTDDSRHRTGTHAHRDSVQCAVPDGMPAYMVPCATIPC